MHSLKPLPSLFSAHIELRRILTGRVLPPVPFTPIECFGLPLLMDAPPVASSSAEFAPQHGDIDP